MVLSPLDKLWQVLEQLHTIKGRMAELDALRVANADLLAALKLAEGHLEEMRLDRKWHPIEHCPVLDLARAAIAKAEASPPNVPGYDQEFEDHFKLYGTYPATYKPRQP